MVGEDLLSAFEKHVTVAAKITQSNKGVLQGSAVLSLLWSLDRKDNINFFFELEEKKESSTMLGIPPFSMTVVSDACQKNIMNTLKACIHCMQVLHLILAKRRVGTHIVRRLQAFGKP